MPKIAVLVLADTETQESLGRVVNALMVSKEFAEAGDEVRIVVDGAGTRWVGELAAPDHRYHRLFEEMKPHVTGACAYCAKAFGVKEQVEAAGVPLLADYAQHPSVRSLVVAGFQVLTF